MLIWKRLMSSKVRAIFALGTLTALAAVTTLNPLPNVSGQDKESPTRKVEKQGEKKTEEKDEKKSEAPVPVKIAEPKREDRSKKTESPPVKSDEKAPKVEGKVPMTSDEKVPGSRPGEKKDDPGSPGKKGDEKNSKETMPEKGKPVPGNVKTESTEPKVERGQAGANSEEMTHEGQLVVITGNRLTMMLKDGKQRAFQLMGDARLTLDGKASRATDLKPGIMLRVTTPTTEQGAAIRVEGQSKSPNPVENTRVPKKETLFPIPEGQAKSRDCECHAQNAANNWIFGTRARINFGGNPPSSSVTTSLPVSNAFNTAEGCSTISDASGDLLFYTDGTTVWDKNHNQMSNGTGLNGNSTSTQSALIVPCSCHKYFIFTTGNQNDYAVGLCYSIVDMTLNTNLGAVVTKNTPLLANSPEKVAAVSDGNGGYWVVAHSMDDNCFHSFRILSGTCTPQLPAVVSAVGASYADGYSKFGQGQMKFSPDGKLLAHAGLNTETAGGPPSFVELFSFSKSTGSITNYLGGAVTTRDTKPNRFYGLEFSPDSQSLWATTTQTTSVIYHYPITSGIGLGTPTPLPLPGGAVAALQLGPDNKIYVARIGQSSIYVLPTPNAVNGGWISPTDTANLLELAAGSSSQYGLPTVIAGDYCGSNPGGNTVACGCCPGENRIKNGDFEHDNDAFHSEYEWTELGPSLVPGTYSVNHVDKIGKACSNWNLPKACDGTKNFSENVLIVNGLTNQPAGSTSVIWSQQIVLPSDTGLKGADYRLCFRYLPLPQCCFDIQAKPFILVDGGKIPLTDVCDEDKGCGHIYAATFHGGGTINLQIVLPGDGKGDGNDLLIDNISMVKIVPVPSAVVDFDYSAAGTGGTKDVTLTANSPNLTSPAYTWWWEMWDTTDPNNPVLLQTVLGNPGNVTTVTFPGLMMKPKTYLFKLKVESDCESMAGSMQDWDFGPIPTARSAKGKSIVDPNPEPLNRKTIRAGNPEAIKREKGPLPTKRSE